MSHRAEIQFPPPSPGTSPADPSSIVVNHHRVPRVELRAEMLTGGHLYHLSLAGCVFNNIFRLAAERQIDISRATVAADGEFDDEGSLGVTCEIELVGNVSDEELRKVAQDAAADSTIGAAIGKGAPVTLAEVRVSSSE